MLLKFSTVCWVLKVEDICSIKMILLQEGSTELCIPVNTLMVWHAEKYKLKVIIIIIVLCLHVVYIYIYILTLTIYYRD